MAKKPTHPARYSAALLDHLRPILADAPHVHDPFAGTGERLGALCDELGVTYTGTELEAPFIVDPRVRQGDSRSWRTYPCARPCAGRCPVARTGPYWIVTSPVYANGMADNFRPTGICSACKGRGHSLFCDVRGRHWTCAKCDGTGRRTIDRATYRIRAMQITGNPDYELDDANMGRNSYRGGSTARQRYWTIAHTVIANWHNAERIIVNVANFWLGDDLIDHVKEWRVALDSGGYCIDDIATVPTPGYRNGANHNRRVGHEAIISARPIADTQENAA